MTTTIAALPDHNRLNDPLWRKLFHSYRHVIAPLRHNGWVTDIETCGGEYHVRADLGDGTELIIASEYSLPVDPAEVTGWMVLRQNIETPSQHSVLYDSTPDRTQAHHGNGLIPMFARIDELDVPKITTQLMLSGAYSAPYGASHTQCGPVEAPGTAVARYFEWTQWLAANDGYRQVWERPEADGYPLSFFERVGHAVVARITRVDAVDHLAVARTPHSDDLDHLPVARSDG
ncbi:hypothetical protein [Streptomyces sp. CB02115]|uniref:hypothetical protein n=1 Tax=Streptomyces sp. CB02115 TaxID=1703939 RepID=UPI00093D4ABA|nr:hypothetical protein [Streptomyces sp. CB02115]